MKIDIENIMTPKQAAAALGCSLGQLYAYIRRGDLPTIPTTEKDLIILDSREVSRFRRPKMGRPPKNKSG